MFSDMNTSGRFFLGIYHSKQYEITTSTLLLVMISAKGKGYSAVLGFDILRPISKEIQNSLETFHFVPFRMPIERFWQ